MGETEQTRRILYKDCEIVEVSSKERDLYYIVHYKGEELGAIWYNGRKNRWCIKSQWNNDDFLVRERKTFEKILQELDRAIHDELIRGGRVNTARMEIESVIPKGQTGRR